MATSQNQLPKTIGNANKEKLTKMSNQDIEKRYFELFRQNYKLPEGIVTYKDKPDVILDGNKKIGIEITNFFLESGKLPESEQKQRKAREKVIEEAQRIYLDNGGEKIQLSFSFDKASPIGNEGEKKKLINKIIDLAKNIDELKSGQICKDKFKHIPELWFVYLNSNEYEKPKWRLTQCYKVQTMSIEKLREIVNTKEKQSVHYERCDAYWLLVVVDFMDSAQDQEIMIDVVKKIDSAVFEKVIVYKTCFGEVFEAK
jgi:hypothetical protein